MRHGLNELKHEYNSEETDEMYDVMPSQCHGMSDLVWGGWVKERTVTMYQLTPKALDHLRKFNTIRAKRNAEKNTG